MGLLQCFFCVVTRFKKCQMSHDARLNNTILRVFLRDVVLCLLRGLLRSHASSCLYQENLDSPSTDSFFTFTSKAAHVSICETHFHVGNMSH